MRNILIVDDDRVTIGLIKLYLSGYGYNILSAETALSTFNIIENTSVDVVLLDVMLPDSNGYDVCRKINELFKGISVIIVTSIEDDSSIEKAFESGAVDYLRKPINRTELHSRLKNVLETIDAKFKLEKMYSNLVKELDIAKNVQSYFIPDPVQIEPRLIFSSFYMPSNKVGGDLFDIKKINDNKYLVYIGDISGHGVQAALLMTAVKFILNMIVEELGEMISPAAVLSKFNKIFCSQLKKKEAYLTMLLGVIDLEKKEFSFYNAGHPPLLVINSITGEAVPCEGKGGVPVGWMYEYDYSEADTDRINIDEDSNFLMFTDGIFESRKEEGGNMGIEGLKKMAGSIKDVSLITVPHSIVNTVSINGYRFEDDYTLFCWSLKKAGKQYLSCRNRAKDVMMITEAARKIFDDFENERNSKGLWMILNQDISTFFKKKDNKCYAGFMVKLALHEWLMNIVRHGTAENENFQIILEIDTESAEVKVYDFGKEWDFNHERSAAIEKNSSVSDLYGESGRGIQMILTLTQDFSFRRMGAMNEAFFKFKKKAYLQEGLDG